MKLWILKARKCTGYIHNQNIIIRAECEADAREIAASDESNDRWLTMDYASCERLTQNGDPGVILVDNNGS